MRNFRDRLARAEDRIDRAFAEKKPAVLHIGDERRPVTVILERPDRAIELPSGGEISRFPAAVSARTSDIAGIAQHCTVELDGVYFRITHVGADEEGRTRITLTDGKAGQPVPVVPGQWVKK